jgi:hypothetical protein
MFEQHLLYLARLAKHQIEPLLRRQPALKGQLEFQLFDFIVFTQLQDQRHL